MRRLPCLFLAAISMVFAAAAGLAATRPHYGGTLRIDLRAALSSLDLAKQSDVQAVDDAITIRRLICGPAADPETSVPCAMSPVGPAGLTGRAGALSLQMALPTGTGPFRLAEWQPGIRVLLDANDDYRNGRPYVDAIDVRLGRASRAALLDLELGKADLAELNPSQARRAGREKFKVWCSEPIELIALKFNTQRPAVRDVRVREAIADSIDRSAIQRVLLQDYGEAAGGFLPAWISGYGFLFPIARRLDRARQLVSQVGAFGSLTLGYQAADSLCRQVAERVAVNAGDAGIRLRLVPSPAGGIRDFWVQRYRIEGPTFGDAVRQAAAQSLFAPAGNSLEEVYAAEQSALNNAAIIPLVVVPEIVALGPRVRNWEPDRWGRLRLENVWLEANRP
jgi:ABC-type transport system substrate-binding protein